MASCLVFTATKEHVDLDDDVAVIHVRVCMGMIHRYYRARRHARDGLDTQTHRHTAGRGKMTQGREREKI